MLCFNVVFIAEVSVFEAAGMCMVEGACFVLYSGSIKVTKTSEDRWQKILSYDDPKALWNAINWRGTFDTPGDATEAPSDKEFCEHLC